MLLYTLIALALTTGIGYLYETIRMKINIEKVIFLNNEMRGELKFEIEKNRKIDMFMINNIRTMINDKFLDIKKIDEFKIYRLEASKLRLVYKSKRAIQKLDIYIDSKHITVKEVSLYYIDDPVELFDIKQH